MGNVIINEKYLKDIAAALRVKYDTNKKYKTNEMAAAIQAIPQDIKTGIPVDEYIATRSITGNILAPESQNLTNVFRKTKITSFNAPKLTDIEAYAFSECTNLLTFHSGQEHVTAGVGAFEYCDVLSDVGDSWFYAYKEAFIGCTLLKQVRISNIYSDPDPFVVDEVSKIAKNVFTNCTNLKKIDISGPLTVFDCYQHVSGCSALKTVILRNTSYRTKINNSTLALPNDCYFYVPSSIYNAYVEYAETITYSSDKQDYLRRLRRIEDYPNICAWEEAE